MHVQNVCPRARAFHVMSHVQNVFAAPIKKIIREFLLIVSVKMLLKLISIEILKLTSWANLTRFNRGLTIYFVYFNTYKKYC